MRIAFILALGFLLLPAAAHAAGPVERSNPYAALFKGQLQVLPAPRTPLPAPAIPPLPFAVPVPSNSSTVVCGMTIVPANPALDARMVVPVPPNSAKPSIRTITPRVCLR